RGLDRTRVDRPGHEVAPDPRRKPAAGDPARKRRVVVIADPDPDHQIVGKADEQSVSAVLAGAGLAISGDAQRGTAAGAAGDDCAQQVAHRPEGGVAAGAGGAVPGALPPGPVLLLEPARL